MRRWTILILVALSVIGVPRGLWLAVPVLWPAAQPLYKVPSLPAMSPAIALFWAIPIPGLTIAGVPVGRELGHSPFQKDLTEAEADLEVAGERESPGNSPSIGLLAVGRRRDLGVMRHNGFSEKVDVTSVGVPAAGVPSIGWPTGSSPRFPASGLRDTP